MKRRYHGAPSDYAIIELLDEAPEKPPFVVLRHGREIARTMSSEGAWRLAEHDQARHALHRSDVRNGKH